MGVVLRILSPRTLFLMKLAFKLQIEQQHFWFQVLRNKYSWKERRLDETKSAHMSYLWQHLLVIHVDLKHEMRWSIGYRSTTRFWSDHWLGDHGPLCHLADRPITAEEMKLPLSTFISQDGL